MPQPKGDNTIAKRTAVLRRLENEQMPAKIRGVAREILETVAPEMDGVSRAALPNLWLLGPAVQAQLEKAPGTNAMVRTTTTLTVLQAGNSVLPRVVEQRGRAVVSADNSASLYFVASFVRLHPAVDCS